MSATRVAKRYSKALVNLSSKQNNHEQVAKDLKSFVDGLEENPTIMAALSNPSIDREVRKQVLARILSDLKIAGLSADFLSFLGEKERMAEVAGILEDFQQRMDELAGRVRATVTSAVPLSSQQHEQIKSTLEKTTGKTVILEASVDASLFGGVVTRVGNLVLDGSIKTALSSMKEQLLRAVH